MTPLPRRSALKTIAGLLGLIAVGGSVAMAATDWGFSPKPGVAILVHEYGSRKPLPSNYCEILERGKVIWHKKNAASSGRPTYVPLRAGPEYTFRVTAPGHNMKPKKFKLTKNKIEYVGEMFRN